jgi:hypothetical protein
MMEMKNRSSAYERCEETIEALFMRISRRKFFRWKLKALAVHGGEEWRKAQEENLRWN